MHFDSAGVPIHFVDEGSGEPVLLLHGFVVDLQVNWVDTGVLPALSRAHRVIAMDLRGHGRSGRPHDPAAYGLEMARDALRLLDHLDVDRAHVVGFSMGGELALALLDLAPQRLRSLVLAGAGWMRPGDFKHRSWGDGAAPLAAVPPGTPISAHLWPDPDAGPPAALRAVIDRNDPAALAAVSAGMQAVTVSEAVLRATRVPTLVVFGEHDWIRPTADGMAEAMPALELRILRGLDHEASMASPELARAIGEFVARHVEGEGG